MYNSRVQRERERERESREKKRTETAQRRYLDVVPLNTIPCLVRDNMTELFNQFCLTSICKENLNFLILKNIFQQKSNKNVSKALLQKASEIWQYPISSNT